MVKFFVFFFIIVFSFSIIYFAEPMAVVVTRFLSPSSIDGDQKVEQKTEQKIETKEALANHEEDKINARQETNTQKEGTQKTGAQKEANNSSSLENKSSSLANKPSSLEHSPLADKHSPLTNKSLKQAIKDQRGYLYIQRCYASYLSKHASLTGGGHITIHFVAQPRGRLTDVQISNSSFKRAKKFHDCIKTVFKRIRIKSFKGEKIHVTFPLNLF